MKNKILKIIIIIFSIGFAVRVSTIFIADRCYSMSLSAKASKAIELLNFAEKLDSTNVNLYFTEYEILDQAIQTDQLKNSSKNSIEVSIYRKKQINLLKTAIDLCPSWPLYHIYYGITLKQITLKQNILIATQILSQLKMSVELKPFSPKYTNIYEKYNKKFIKQYGPIKIQG